MQKKQKIFLSGGGTLGSVMPLLALWEELQKNYNCFWIGSRNGVEREVIEKRGIRYIVVPSGKMRKYLSLKNFLTPFLVFSGLIFSFLHLLIHRPKLIIVSGSFVSVPLVWAGWILRVPVIVHQEDQKIGLAGKLTIPFATVVTTAFKDTAKTEKHKNIYWVGNPVRNIFYNVDKNKAEKKWKVGDLPLVLVLGGGLGSERINRVCVKITQSINNRCQIINITGKNKATIINIKNYRQIERLDEEIAEVMMAADIVVSRAGLSTLGELSVLGKPAILIPLKGVGQDENALYFANQDAAVVVNENMLENLEYQICDLLDNRQKRSELSENIKKIFLPNSTQKFLEIIESFLA